MPNNANNSTICIKSTKKKLHSAGYISVSSLKSLNTTYAQPSNLLPHFWLAKVVDKEGRPDLPCILILSEVFGWFRSLSESKTYYSTGTSLPELVDGKLALSYDFLSNKLNFEKERLRRNFVKLEKLNILSREIKNISIKGGSRISQLFLSINEEFFKSCFRDPELDIRVGDDDAHTPKGDSAFEDDTLSGGEHKWNKSKTRSMKSNFLDSKDLEEETKSNKDTSPDTKPLLQQRGQQQLGYFYPLTSEDCSLLQRTSSREFSLNAMNEILKDMSKKITKAKFWSKKGFLAYMSKAFEYEKRDAVKISNTSFKIRSNQDKEEQTIQTQEKYLTELEYSLQVSPEWHLKKKLVSVLERNKAYNLLTSFKNLDIKEGVCVLNLRKPIHLTKNDKEIILNQIQATHSNIGLNNSSILIESLNIKMPKPYVSRQTGEGAQNKTNETYEAKKDETIWGKIRSSLSSQYGEGIDRAWFSRLNASINKESKEIILTSSSGFVTDWVKDNYTQSIQYIASEFDFEINIKNT